MSRLGCQCLRTSRKSASMRWRSFRGSGLRRLCLRRLTDWKLEILLPTIARLRITSDADGVKCPMHMCSPAICPGGHVRLSHQPHKHESFPVGQQQLPDAKRTCLHSTSRGWNIRSLRSQPSLTSGLSPLVSIHIIFHSSQRLSTVLLPASDRNHGVGQ